MIKSKVDKFNSNRIIVVADNGMYAQENFYLLLKAGNGFIVSKSIKRSWSSMRDYALDKEGYIEFKNNQNEVVFKYKSFIEDSFRVLKTSDHSL